MKKHAFTMLELIFVIIILGIVSSIAASVLAKIYENHLIQRSIHQISINTELAAEQIANRLQFSIPMLVVARQPTNFANVVELYHATGGDNVRTALEWIAYDNDSFTASTTPGWSGYADLNSSLPTAVLHSVRTPGSNLNLTNTIMSNLSRDRVRTTGAIGAAQRRPNLIFSGDIPYRYLPGAGADILYRTTCLGLGNNPAQTGCSIPFTTTSFPNFNDRINFTKAVAINMGEFYKLSWSAYAIVPSPLNADGTFDLTLRSNYQPWAGDTWVAGKSNTLIRNVTVFKFMESAGTLRFKLCAKSFITGTTDFVSACKEKVITR